MKALFCIFIALFAMYLFGATFIVDQAGTGDFTDIQPAINACSSGDIIRVKPGTYSAITMVNTKDNLKLIGSGTELCVIQGLSTNAVDVVQGCDGTLIQGFKIVTNAASNFAINNYGGSTVITNCVVCDCPGTGVYCGQGNVTIRNSVITRNQTGFSRNTAYGGNLLQNCCIFNNTGTGLASNATSNYCCFYGNGTNTSGGTHSNMVSANPLFVDAINDNFRLQSGSPCIDAGLPGTTEYDLNGTRNDIGVYGGPYAYPGGGPCVRNIIVSPSTITAGQPINVVGTATTQ